MNRKARRKRLPLPSIFSSRAYTGSWKPKLHGRILNDFEQQWCNQRHLERGWDGDDCVQQHSHLVPVGYRVEPICGAQDLCFMGGQFGMPRSNGRTYVEEDNRITCLWCLARLKKMMKKDSVLTL